VPELTIFKPALKFNDIYITLSQELDNSEAIMRDFNRGINIIRENGLYQKIKEKHFKRQLIQSKQ
jgi:ABC-type amino acid transport substrate-binding protein